MNAKISQDESALENISIGNRPMKVAEEYTLLTSNAWLDAKTELDRFFGEDQEEENKIKLLYATLIVSGKDFIKHQEASNRNRQNNSKRLCYMFISFLEKTRNLYV